VFGFFDGIAAFVLAGYCAVTAVVYHNFWSYPRFWSPKSDGYSHVWDFFKNFGLVGGLIFVMYASGFIQDVGGDIEKMSAVTEVETAMGGRE
jgi:putative oxidoreductase